MTPTLVDLNGFDDPDAMLETLDILSDLDTMAIAEAEASLTDEAHWTGQAQGY